MNKDIKKFLIILMLYGLAGGIFYNYEELWLDANNMSISTISTVLSLCALITVSVIFLCSNIIKPKRLKKFSIILVVIKTIVLTTLFFLYQSNLNILIKFLIMVDYAADTEFGICIYPLISMIEKNDKLYAVKGLIYEISAYVGGIFVGIFLGKRILNITVSYNTYCILAAILMLISLVILISINMRKYLKDNDISYRNDILIRLLKKIKRDKISIFYLGFSFFCDIAYYSLVGIFIIILTTELSLSSTVASYVKLFSGIGAGLVGVIILSKLTLKNDYINISIKYVFRFISYLLPIFCFTKMTVVIGLFYTVLTSSAYTHILDAPYINRFDNEEQLAFANLKV